MSGLKLSEIVIRSLNVISLEHERLNIKDKARIWSRRLGLQDSKIRKVRAEENVQSRVRM